METEEKRFFEHWFAGWAEGLAALDEPSRLKMLEACGRACARSYTAQVFRQAKDASTDMVSFLTNLARRFPEADYERVAPRTIRATYHRCACDLVESGLVASPLLCDCSAANLRANFAAALGSPVAVTVAGSILRGAGKCVLVVEWGE